MIYLAMDGSTEMSSPRQNSFPNYEIWSLSYGSFSRLRAEASLPSMSRRYMTGEFLAALCGLALFIPFRSFTNIYEEA